MMISIVRRPIRQWLFRASSYGSRQIHDATKKSSTGDSMLQATCVLQMNARSYQTTAAVFQPKEDVHVTIETSDPKSQSDLVKDSKCGPVDDEEMEQEEMFVTSDPILGHGKIQEWGGPRRGGRLAEPTRFGDWERKGRCTDF